MSRSIVVFLTLLAFSSLAFSVDISSCQVISAPGTYDVTASFSGSTSNYWYATYTTCVLVRDTSNVVIDCHGYSITETGGGSGAPVAVRNSTNVTVQNCNLTGSRGFAMYEANYTTATNNNLSAGWGFTSVGNNYYNTLEYNNVVAGTYGFFWPVENSTIRYNNVTAPGSIAYLLSGYNTVTDNYAYDSPRCFSVYGGGTAERNIAYNCSDSCYSIPYYGSNANLINNTADTCGDGFYTQGGSNSLIQDNIIRNVENGVYLRTWFSEGIDYASGFVVDGNQISNCGVGITGYYDINNNFTDNVVTGATYHGVQMNNSDNDYFSGNTITGSGQSGFVLNSATNSVFDGDSATGNGEYGYYLSSASGSSFTDVTGSGNTLDGMRALNSDSLVVDPSYFCNNLDYGLYINDSDDTLVEDSVFCNNTNDGLRVANSDNVTISGNTAYDNDADGIETEETLEGLSVTDNTAYGNEDNGIHVYNFYYNNVPVLFSGNTVYGNSFNGIEFSVLRDSVISDNTAYENRLNGFRWSITHNNSWSNNTAYASNESSGFFGSNSDGNVFTDMTAYNNFEHGFRFVAGADNNSLSDSTFYGNTEAGLYVLDSTQNVMTNLHLYGNSPDVLVDGSGITLELNNVIVDNDAGSMTNYSNITVDDFVASEYSLDWAAQPAPLPSQFRSFQGKFLDVTNLTTGVSIDRLAMHWLEAELAPDYQEPKLRMALYDGASWMFLNSTPDETNNELSYEAITETATVALLEFLGGDDGGDETPTEDELDISFDSACEGNIVTVKSDGSAVSGASVLVFHQTTLDDVASGSTGSDGKFNFTACGMPVKILASKTGYQSASATKTLIACSECALGCVDDDDCSDKERCVNNMCERVECSCGYIESHDCVNYECCQDSDCEEGQACLDNQCEDQFECFSDDDCGDAQYCDVETGASGGSCEDVTGACGYPEDHEWVQYECGDDENCTECQRGYTCVNHECEENEVQGEDGFVGDRKKVKVLRGGEPCAECDIQITGPDGKTFTGKTDGNGEFELPLTLEGTYKVVLVDESGDAAAEGALNSLPKPAPVEEEKPTETVGPDASVMFLVLLLVLAIAGLVYWRRGRSKS